MRLPEELDQDFWQEISQYEEEKKMPYVSSVEKIGIKKGIQQGIQQGKQEGRREGLLEGIELALSVKFGRDGLKLMPAIQMADMELLNAVKETIKKSDDLKEIEALLK